MKLFIHLLFLLSCLSRSTIATAQAGNSAASPDSATASGDEASILDTTTDTTRLIPLSGVTVSAYELGQPLATTPASVGIVTQQLLRRYANTSIVSAVNSIPGVRMEERSPGSYRLAIRGSSLRAPFGVRNVKIYYNGIPFTDPGGHTNLNQLGYYNFSNIEIIKGPGSSLYGAGTGGVALIGSMPAKMQRGFGIEVTGGSYGLAHLQAEVRHVDNSSGLRSIVRYQHLTSDGYREHSDLRRDVLSWDLSAKLSASTSVNTHFLYTDLHYETPGALTIAEYHAQPRNARPAVGAVPGATMANAAIKQKAFLTGSSLEHNINQRWSYSATLYGAYTLLQNPTLRNYGRGNEPHAGGRTVLKYRHDAGERGRFNWLLGAEAQQGLAGTQIYSTKSGNPDTLQTDDKLHIRTAIAFTQGSFEWRRWLLTGGVSINNYRVRYARLSSSPFVETVRDFNNEAAPRIAINYRINKAASIYLSAARGFSPPTGTDLSPSGGILNNTLRAEYGWSYEAGTRGTFLEKRFSYDLSVYYFAIVNTIVQRRDSAGGDYFINSGSTRQTGAEASVRYQFIEPTERDFELSGFASYSYQHYRYKDFFQIEQDYSGNSLPGVSPNTLAAGLDWSADMGLYARLSYFYSDLTPLNDANSASLESYHLLSARVGYRLQNTSGYRMEIFAGGENLTNITYSAGPDINAFGGRYYNAAPGRNFYAGISLQRAR